VRHRVYADVQKVRVRVLMVIVAGRTRDTNREVVLDQLERLARKNEIGTEGLAFIAELAGVELPEKAVVIGSTAPQLAYGPEQPRT
jgi:hypothetical protein